MLRSTLVALALVLLCAGSVQAQDDQRARLHFEAGASYYEAGEYEDALREFQRAYELSQRPQLFYNLSLCYQNLGDLANAVSYLERYLNEVPNIENRANLEIRLRNLRERLEHDQAARAGGTTGAAASETRADGTTGVGTSQTATGETATGETATGGSATGETTTGETTETTTVASTESSTGAGGASGEAPLNVGAIAGFSVAAVGLVTAGIFGGLTVAEDSRLAATPCGMSGTCPEADLGTLRAYAAVTDAGFGVALAGAVVGLVFVIVGPGSSGDEQAAVRVAPMAGREGVGASIGGSF